MKQQETFECPYCGAQQSEDNTHCYFCSESLNVREWEIKQSIPYADCDY
jgi:endogenous inhibitor of DNA gyrase (YacG/DUF329 family)